MGWQDDLWNLLTEVDPNPVEDITGSAVAQPVIGALTSGPAQRFYDFMDLPLQPVKAGTGELLNIINKAPLLIPGGPQEFDPAMAEAYRLGGGRGAWEQRRAQEPLWFQAGSELLLDPTTYLGFGAGKNIAAGARTMANVAEASGRPVIAAGLRGTETLAKGSQFLWNDAPGQILLPPIQGAARTVARGIERVAPGALDLSPRFAFRRTTDAARNAMLEKRSAKPSIGRTLPAMQPIAQGGPPPIIPSVHPPKSAPSGLIAGLRQSWTNLTDPRTGVINIKHDKPWMTPADVQLTRKNLNDMAYVGAGIMQQVADAGGIMPALVRSTDGMAKLRGELIAQHGPGIEPWLPVIYGRMRELLGDQADSLMPSSRYLLPHGWSKANVGTKRLQRIDAMKTLSREEKLKKIARFPKTRPEAVEAAAAQGAALLTGFRQGSDDAYTLFQPNGAYFPKLEQGVPNARAIIPEGFRDDLWQGGGKLDFDLSEANNVLGVPQPFGSNREAWNTYMRQTFGNLADDELDTLADMSTEIAYDAYVNAANQFSGGAKGATRIARAEVNPQTGEMAPTVFRTKGVIDPETGGVRQRIANTSRKTTPDKGVPKGGILPSLKQLMDGYESGKGLSAGTGIAGDLYERGAREIQSLVGNGSYEDARFLIDALAVTSAGTDVERNAYHALRALAEWKFGSDTTLRERFGLSGADFDSLRTGGMLRADMDKGHRNLLAKQFTEYARIRDGTQFTPPAIHGGAKTHQYAGSYLAQLWRTSFDKALKGAGRRAPIVNEARKAFDDALAVFAVDRHINRIDNLATGVSPIEDFLIRERHLLAARSGNLSPEQAQSAGWYWVRGRQGILSEVGVNSDTAASLRKVVDDMVGDTTEMEGGFNELVARLGAETGLDAEKALDESYDLIRQEMFYRLLRSSLDKPEVRQALARAGIGHDLQSLQADTLGLLGRGAAGLAPEEWPQPLGARESHALLTATETAAGTPGATMLRFDGDTWVSGTPGLAVPLRDVGTINAGQVQTARKAMEKFIQRRDISRVLDDFGEHVGFATLPLPNGKQRIVLVAAADDPDVAAKAGARAIDLQGGAATPAGPGGVAARDLSRTLRELFGEPSGNPRASLEEVRRRGITLAEQDMANPVSIFQRQVADPLMDAYGRISMEDGVPAATGAKDLGSLDLPDWPDRAASAQMGYDPKISLNANETLATTLKDGTTIGAFTAKYSSEAELDIAALKDAGVHWGPYDDLPARIKAVADNPKRDQLEKIIKKWNTRGIDPMHAQRPDDVAAEMLERQLAKDAGEKANARSTVWDLFQAAWGEMALLSPKYHAANIQGNWIANALGGTFTSLNPRDYNSAYKVVRAGVDETTRAEALASLKSTQIANKWGLEQAPVEIMRGGVRALTSNEARSSPSAVGELAGRLTRSAAVGRKVGAIFIANNDVGLAVDTIGRGSLWSDVFDREMRFAMPAWEDEVRQRGAAIPGFEFSVLDGINIPPGGLYVGPLKQQLVDLGLQEGMAEHLVRSYTSIRSRAQKLAKVELDRRQFSYDRTNLDEWIGRFVPFHYWFSRALRFYGEEAIRHPFLALNYMRANDGIEDAQNDPGLSARQKGFLRLFGTPLGFSLLMNPDALFGVVKVFGMTDDYDPDGQTALGGVVDWLKVRGFGLYPWFDGLFNLMGMYGNTFEPDLLGIRHKSLVGAAINTARAHFGFDPAGAPYADAMGQARYAVSSFVSSFTPDWLSQTVTPKAGGSTQEAALDTIIENIIIQSNPGLTNEQLLGIMTDPESPEYQAAFTIAADHGIAQQLLNFVIPQRFTYRYDSRDTTTAAVNTIRDAAQKKGVAPFQFAPTPGDLDFAARYEAMTGKQWKPGDYETAAFRHNMTRTPEEQKPFLAAEAAWQNLGSPPQQRAWQTYQDLAFGNDPRTAGLPPEAQREIANQWLDRTGSGKAIEDVAELRQAFEATHPEFAEFRAWQGKMYDLQSAYGGTLAEYRRQASQQNPNAARYFADQEAWMQATMPQSQWESYRETYTTNANAWQAITGKGTLRSIQGPYPGVPPVDLTLPGMLPSDTYASGGGTDWARELASISPSRNFRPNPY
jgi:hypothetical protein